MRSCHVDSLAVATIFAHTSVDEFHANTMQTYSFVSRASPDKHRLTAASPALPRGDNVSSVLYTHANNSSLHLSPPASWFSACRTRVFGVCISRQPGVRVMHTSRTDGCSRKPQQCAFADKQLNNSLRVARICKPASAIPRRTSPILQLQIPANRRTSCAHRTASQVSESYSIVWNAGESFDAFVLIATRRVGASCAALL